MYKKGDTVRIRPDLEKHGTYGTGDDMMRPQHDMWKKRGMILKVVSLNEPFVQLEDSYYYHFDMVQPLSLTPDEALMQFVQGRITLEIYEKYARKGADDGNG